MGCQPRDCRCARSEKFCGCGMRASCRKRAIAKSLGLSQGAVSGYLSRARAAGVVWPLPDDVDDVQLEAMLFPRWPSRLPQDRTEDHRCAVTPLERPRAGYAS